MANLECINFGTNKIEQIHVFSFKDFSSLLKIYFDQNKINELNQSILNGLNNLKFINFKNNLISNMPKI